MSLKPGYRFQDLLPGRAPEPTRVLRAGRGHWQAVPFTTNEVGGCVGDVILRRGKSRHRYS